MNGVRERQMEKSTRDRRPGAAALYAALAIVGLLPLPVLAYVGPGADLSALGSLLALVAAVFVAIVGFLWFPIKRLFGRKRTSPPVETSEASPAAPAHRAADRRDDEKR